MDITNIKAGAICHVKKIPFVVGQGAIVQYVTLRGTPVHSSGLEQNRVCLEIPYPQEFEQDDHEDQADQTAENASF